MPGPGFPFPPRLLHCIISAPHQAVAPMRAEIPYSLVVTPASDTKKVIKYFVIRYLMIYIKRGKKREETRPVS